MADVRPRRGAQRDDVRDVRGAARPLRGGGRGRLASFSSGEDGLRYEATIDRIVGRLEAVRKPTIALVDGYAMGSGLALSAACDLRVCTPEATFGMPIARNVGNCLSMANYARLAGLLGEARLKDVVFTARSIGAEEALAIGLATAVVGSDEVEAHVEELCERVAGHAAVTLRVTKEALRGGCGWCRRETTWCARPTAARSSGGRSRRSSADRDGHRVGEVLLVPRP